MKLFLDSADPDVIARVLNRGRGPISGVTTNPSLMAKTVKTESYEAGLRRVCDAIREHANVDKFETLSVEVLTLDKSTMVDAAHDIYDVLIEEKCFGPVIKIPISYRGVSYVDVISELTADGLAVNATCIFSVEQGILAQCARAKYISLFWCRAMDRYLANVTPDTECPEDAVRELRLMLDQDRADSEIIAGSIRTARDGSSAFMAGAHIVTASETVINGMAMHPGTDASVEGFDKDIRAWLSGPKE